MSRNFNTFIKFQSPQVNNRINSYMTTMAVGEEGGGDNSSISSGKEKNFNATTMALGEEGGGDNFYTTCAVGEEGGGDDFYTTCAVGEEGGGDAPSQELAQTNELLSTIVQSDINNDGSISKNEISTQSNMLNSQIKMLEFFSSIPFFGELFKPMIEQMQEKLDTINVIKNNFNVFSKNGESTDKIEGGDIIKIIQSAGSDGNIENFSEKDLRALKYA